MNMFLESLYPFNMKSLMITFCTSDHSVHMRRWLLISYDSMDAAIVELKTEDHAPAQVVALWSTPASTKFI